MEYVVRIYALCDEFGKIGGWYGTGVILDSGHILTNYHVLPKRVIKCEIYHTASQRKLTFKRLVKYSVWFDLSLIEIEEKIKGVKLAKIMVPIGGKVKQIGFAFGRNLTPTVMEAIIARYTTVTGCCTPLSIELDKYIISGMSGGPVLYKDKLVGLNSASSQALAHSIPLFQIQKFLSIDAEEVDEHIYVSKRIYIDTDNTVYGLNVSLDGLGIQNGKVNLKDLGLTPDDVYIAAMFVLEFLDAKEQLQLYPANYIIDDDYKVSENWIIASSLRFNAVVLDMEPRIYIADVKDENSKIFIGRPIIEPRRIRDIKDTVVVSMDGIPVKFILR